MSDNSLTKTLSKKPSKSKGTKKTAKVAAKKLGLLYLFFSLAVMLVTSLFWSIRSANLQLNNTDQLINPFLMSSWKTFNGAYFPGQHSLLFKWPLFFIVRLFGSSAGAFTFFTVLTVLATIGLLIWLLSKIEKRPEILATLILALAAVLLLVPAQPYSGGLLPVNMAMLSTRNLEYLVYIGSLLLIIRRPHPKNWSFWLGIFGLSLLGASDKLFLGLSIGGAILALIVYSNSRKWDKVIRSVHWFIVGGVTAVFSTILLWLINISGFTHIVNQASASPYSLQTGAHNIATGIFYAGSDFFTNFGANPAFDGITVKSIPHLFASRLFSVGGIGFVVNFLIAIVGILAVWMLLKSSFKANKIKNLHPWDNYAFTAVALIYSSIVTLIIFVLTKHQYTVDSRYLTICLFSVFVTLAVVSRNLNWSVKQLKIAGCVLLLGIMSGTYMADRLFNSQDNALNNIHDRNSLIALFLQHRPSDTLVGDYWRVGPIKLASGNKVNILPLRTCKDSNNILTSSSWNIALNNASFAYLLSFEGNLTNFPPCNLDDIISQYGRPNQSTLTAGSLAHPVEKLLIYDHGISKSAPIATPKIPSTVLPIDIGTLPYTTCNGPSMLNFVAHEDDDLLFMNPKIYQDIKAGDCIRTVYLTAGDAGFANYYYTSREQGEEAAYNYMNNDPKAIWVERIVSLGNNQYLSVDNPRGNSKISLVFMHLPDGNLKGQGFPADRFESLQKLWEGQISSIHSVDHQSSYTSTQLVGALSTLMNTYGPSEINTQSDYINTEFPDHSDHLAVGNFVKNAYAKYEKEKFSNQVTIPISYYIGYPIRTKPVNLSNSDAETKINILLSYAKYDGAICQSLIKCLSVPTYSKYLSREYTNPY